MRGQLVKLYAQYLSFIFEYRCILKVGERYSPNTTDIPVVVEDILVDVLGMFRVLEIRTDDELAKVNL